MSAPSAVQSSCNAKVRTWTSYQNPEHQHRRIDAGKTTTTERVLYYSGTIPAAWGTWTMGRPSDFDVEEQQRWHRIYNAAVSFEWRDCRVNLIDTPGHVDFTVEEIKAVDVMKCFKTLV